MIHVGDCREVMAGLEPNSIDAIVTDPPYELGFMGKGWDASGIAYQPDVWAQAYRVLKPGGHLAAFGGTRTYHRMAVAIEDAGFEIRDSLMWLYGSGFPKSLDVSKAIDKRPGASSHREFAAHLADRRRIAGLSRADVSEAVVGTRSGACWNWEHHQFPEAKWWTALRDLLSLDEAWGDVIAAADRDVVGNRDGSALAVAPGQGVERGRLGIDITAPATDAAREWEGWGTALKPAFEPIVLARKPLSGTVAQTVLEHGTGALNIDGARIAGVPPSVPQPDLSAARKQITGFDSALRNGEMSEASGRWPANVILDPEAAALLDQQAPDAGAGGQATGATRTGLSVSQSRHAFAGIDAPAPFYGDQGGASRFFYCAKASRAEREAGLDGLPLTRRVDSESRQEGAPGSDNPRLRTSTRRNHHPTVKPVSLMRWLVRLVTPPGGLVLDPFTGSGTTGMAAALEGFEFVGAELSDEYAEIARRRIAWAKAEPRSFDIDLETTIDAPIQGQML